MSKTLEGGVWIYASDHTVGRLASAFDQAGIDHVVWGWAMNGLFGWGGWPLWVSEFIVPDAQLNEAIELVSHLGGHLCNDVECKHHPDYEKDRVHPPIRKHPYAPIHLHKDGEGGYQETIELYRQSDLLWFLPSLELDNENVLSVSDDRLGWHRQEENEDRSVLNLMPARVLAQHRALEAFIRLNARDSRVIARARWVEAICFMLSHPIMAPSDSWLKLLAPQFRQYIADIEPTKNAWHVGALRRLLAADPTLDRVLPPGYHSRLWPSGAERMRDEELRQNDLL